MLWTLFSELSAVWTIETASLTFWLACCEAVDLGGQALADRITGGVVSRGVDAQTRGQALHRGDTALLDCRLICVCIAEMLVRIERDIFTPPWCDRFGFVPRLLLAAGLPGYRPGSPALEGRPEPSGHSERPAGQAVTLMWRPGVAVVFVGVVERSTRVPGDSRLAAGSARPALRRRSPDRGRPGAVAVDAAGHRRRA